MKRKGKWSWILACLLLLQCLGLPFASVEASTTSNLDVVFVLDASGSMKKSDPEEIRTEAIKMFLDMGQLQGNKIGLVAYAEAIVREHNLDTMNGAQDKDRIKKMASNIPLGQKTDTGAGLLEAVTLLNGDHDPGHNPVIILLSDGKNDPQRKIEESEKDLKEAIDQCKAKGYTVYTIGLNYDGTVDKSQLEEIASATKGKSYITNTAQDLPRILTDIYADNAKLKVQEGGSFTANGDFQEVKVDIPNANVLEANISMLSDHPVTVKLMDPTGKELPIPSQDAVFTVSKKYAMLKIVKPVEGQWTLKVKGVKGSNIKISFIYNYDLELEGKFTPSTAKKGDKIKVEAFFTSNGQKIIDPELYEPMTSTLLVKNLKDNQIKEVPLQKGKDVFQGEYLLGEEGKFELKVKVDGKSFYRESTPIIVGEETGSTPAPAANKTPSTPKEPEKSFLKNPVTLGVLGAILVGIALLGSYLFVKKKRIQGFGRVELHIKDENTGETTPPQFRNLDGYVGKFTLFEVLGLKESFEETEGVHCFFTKEDALEIVNKSDCTLQRSGRKLDREDKVLLTDGNRIIIHLNKVPKSIIMEFHAK